MNDQMAREVIAWLLKAREAKGFSLYCYCLMPDHMHLVISPSSQGPDVTAIVQQFKSATTHKSWSLGFRGRLWQRSYYDHVARQEADVLAMCQYVIENPVRAGLAQNHGDYPFCALVDPL